MKPIREDIKIPLKQSFRTHLAMHERFWIPWHYHPEFEIIFIEESEGTRFVGDSIDPFRKGDLVMLGEKLPHCWQNNKEHNSGSQNAKALVVHFPGEFWARQFSMLPEMHKLKTLFSDSVHGIKFNEEGKNAVIEKMVKLDACQNENRIISFINFLSQLAECSYRKLASYEFVHTYLHKKSVRMNNVLKYIMNNFSTNISLEDAAGIANMSGTGFARYFKQQTGKNFTSFVNNIRIKYACRLLAEKKSNITQICYEAGFNSLSNFNKTFKEQLNKSPSEYRRKLAAR